MDNKTCGTCKHFTGAGDWDLCCSVGARRLCYKDDEACEQYDQGEGEYEALKQWDAAFELFLAKQRIARKQAQDSKLELPVSLPPKYEPGKWILCRNRLPEQGQDVILFFRDTFHTHISWPKTAVSPAWRCNVGEEKNPDGLWCLTGRLYSSWPGTISLEDGIAWMPLPGWRST